MWGHFPEHCWNYNQPGDKKRAFYDSESVPGGFPKTDTIRKWGASLPG